MSYSSIPSFSLRFNRAAALVVLVGLVIGGSKTAEAAPGPHNIRLEGAAALMVIDERDRFRFGGGFGVGYEYRFIPYLGAEARYGAAFFPVENQLPGAESYGGYHGFGVALRLHPLPRLGLGDLWVSVGGNVVLTGDIVRGGLDAAVGFDFEVVWWLRMGPFVRYTHVFQPNDDALGPEDGGLLTFGLSIAAPGVRGEAGDRDEDGLNDDVDQCPDDPEDIDQFEDENGCPDPDNDQDGIPDVSDRCPNRAEDLDGDADEDGCPEEAGDRDGDGILDDADQCPDAPEDADNFEDENGCPDPDNDGDGFPDTIDRCPNRAETRNDYEDDDGCPDEAPAEAELRQLAERILFDRNEHRPTAASARVIWSVAQLIRSHDEWELIRVQGHASDTGESTYNMELSRRRSEYVRYVLINRHGIPENRLTVEAFGESEPEIQGASEEARTQNRRVVFTILTRAE